MKSLSVAEKFEAHCQETWRLPACEVVMIRATSCAEPELRRVIDGELTGNVTLSRNIRTTLTKSGVLFHKSNTPRLKLTVNEALMNQHLEHSVNNP